jgi:hypothetical protein
MKILHLTLKKKWFDMILSGEKKEEYREIKVFWEKRLKCDDLNEYDFITFTNGYQPTSPRFTIECKGIKIGKGVKDWGGTEKDVFIISLGNIVQTKNL